MINEYIEKVVVYEATGGRQGKHRKQQFEFVGGRLFELYICTWIRTEFI